MDLGLLKKVHFIGIGGIGMSALARLFLYEKKQVSGSDRAPSALTDALAEEGARFFPFQSASNIEDDVELVIYTEAMPKDHEELLAAKKKKIPCINYFEALGVVANPYYLMAVSGTHGKTTTTAMLVDILEDAGLDPTAIVGSLRIKSHSNFRAGKSKYCVVEACEYRRDFLHLKPEILVITNVEAEHLDYYKDLNDVISAFNEFARQVPESGSIVANAKDPVIKRVLEGVSAKIIDYATFFNPLTPIGAPGIHNRLNAAAAHAAAAQVGAGSTAQKSLENFRGTWRRFEYKGEMATQALLYDDYGHHPSEIIATINGARESHPGKKIIVVFQPHTYSRTEALFDDFAAALGMADFSLILPIYAAREENESGVSAERLAGKTPNCRFVPSFEEARSLIQFETGADHVVIVMGAGDIYKLAESIPAR